MSSLETNLLITSACASTSWASMREQSLTQTCELQTVGSTWSSQQTGASVRTSSCAHGPAHATTSDARLSDRNAPDVDGSGSGELNTPESELEDSETWWISESWSWEGSFPSPAQQYHTYNSNSVVFNIPLVIFCSFVWLVVPDL